MLITFCCYLPFLRRPPAFFVRAHSQVSAVRLGETYNRKEASQTWELPAHSHLLVAPWLSWGPSRSGRPDFFFPPKFSETQGPNSTPTHISHFWYVWACLPVIPDQRVRWLGRAVILSILGQEEHPPTFTKIENSYISGFFFHIAEQISTCYFLVVNLSLHTNWTLHRVYANNLLSFITWAF